MSSSAETAHNEVSYTNRFIHHISEAIENDMNVSEYALKPGMAKY